MNNDVNYFVLSSKILHMYGDLNILRELSILL